MSWHYLLEQEEESSEDICWDGEQFVPSKSKTTLGEYCLPDNETESFLDSRSGMTSEPLMDVLGKGESMSSRGGSPAKTSVRQVRVQDLPESVRDFGSRCSELLAKLGLALSSRKTVRSCVPVALAPSSKDLPAWGMTAHGVCWELGTSVRLMEEIEFGYLPTPSGTRSGKNHVIGRLDEWGGSSNPFRGTSLGPVRCPDFEEWMIGWPVRWTVPTAFGMDKFQQWQQQHSGFCHKPSKD